MRFNSVVIAMRFDESRMFELLRHVKAAYPETPVVCIHPRPSRGPSKVTHAAAAMAATLLGL